MPEGFYQQALFSTALIGFFVLLTLVAAVWWLWQGLKKLRAQEGGILPVAISAVVAAVALLAAIGLVLWAALGLPMFLEAMEQQKAGTEQQQAMVDHPAPELYFSGVSDDRRYTLDEFAGQVVLVNFWGTWCGPCVKEMPHLERLQRELGPRGLKVLHLSQEPRDELTRYLEKNQPTNLHVYADTHQWPAFALPTSYIVDRDGVLRAFHVGGTDYDFFAGWVGPYL